MENPEYDCEPNFEPDFVEFSAHADSEPANAQPAISPVAEMPPAEHAPYYWTWLVVSQGFTSEECLAIRRITREVFRDHLSQAAENGLEIKPGWNLAAIPPGLPGR